MIEEFETLDDTGDSVQLDVFDSGSDDPGTTIELHRLRRRWSDAMLGTFVAEVQSFEIPEFLAQPIPTELVPQELLFGRPRIRDTSSEDPGFSVSLSGDFDVGEQFWRELAQRSQWVIEILAVQDPPAVEYAIAPTIGERERLPKARAERWTYPHPDPDSGPFFCARIFVRGTRRIPRPLQAFARNASGIRLFMEGFRVLPYGERGDDWLKLDADYTRRREPFELGGLEGQALSAAVDGETFYRLANNSYYGGVFLTDAGAPTLEMLVNREGFIPEESFDTLTKLLRRGIDLSVRLRAAAENASRTESTDRRAPSTPLGRVDRTLKNALNTIASARSAYPRGLGEEIEKIDHDLNEASTNIQGAIQVLSEARSEQRTLRVAASVGTQLSAFIHEMNTLLGQARSVYAFSERVLEQSGMPWTVRESFSELRDAIAVLVEQLERQASFLTDVVGSNARRRRSRLEVREHVKGALKLLESRIERRTQEVEIEVADGLRTPPMFGSELLGILVNLLSNAVKAAGEEGAIHIKGGLEDKAVILEVSNTGESIELAEAERWFRPFESTTTEVDEVLGQGMGLGLPIVRRIVAEYGGVAEFVPAAGRFATTIRIRIPERSR